MVKELEFDLCGRRLNLRAGKVHTPGERIELHPTVDSVNCFMEVYTELLATSVFSHCIYPQMRLPSDLTMGSLTTVGFHGPNHR